MRKESVNLVVVLNNGKKISSEVDVFYTIDINYGADADGNRGERGVFIEDVMVKDITHDDDGNKLTDEEATQVIDLLFEAAKISI